MALEVVYKKAFENSLRKVVGYLDSEWSPATTDKFVRLLYMKVALLSTMPDIGVQSAKIAGVRSVLVTQHNRLYYKTSGKKLVVLNMYDTRIHPDRKRY